MKTNTWLGWAEDRGGDANNRVDIMLAVTWAHQLEGWDYIQRSVDHSHTSPDPRLDQHTDNTVRFVLTTAILVLTLALTSTLITQLLRLVLTTAVLGLTLALPSTLIALEEGSGGNIQTLTLALTCTLPILH